MWVCLPLLTQPFEHVVQLGGTKPVHDFNQDFEVNFEDFLIQSAHFGQTRNVDAIPEPSAMMLLGIGLLFLRRRRLS